MTGWYADASDMRFHYPWIRDEVVPWLESHGISADFCFRVEIDLLDMPLVRAHLFVRDGKSLALHIVDGRTEPKVQIVEKPMLSQPPRRPEPA